MVWQAIARCGVVNLIGLGNVLYVVSLNKPKIFANTFMSPGLFASGLCDEVSTQYIILCNEVMAISIVWFPVSGYVFL